MKSLPEYNYDLFSGKIAAGNFPKKDSPICSGKRVTGTIPSLIHILDARGLSRALAASPETRSRGTQKARMLCIFAKRARIAHGMLK